MFFEDIFSTTALFPFNTFLNEWIRELPMFQIIWFIVLALYPKDESSIYLMYMFTTLPLDGSHESRKTNLSWFLQCSFLSITASPSPTLFHLIHLISWHSGLHLMQQQLCVVSAVFLSLSLTFFQYKSPPACLSNHITLCLSRPVPCLIPLIRAERADPSLPQHACIDPLPQCVCVILRCSDL